MKSSLSVVVFFHSVVSLSFTSTSAYVVSNAISNRNPSRSNVSIPTQRGRTRQCMSMGLLTPPTAMDAVWSKIPTMAVGGALSWLRFLDASNFFFLPAQTRSFIGTFPILLRIVLGVLALDVLPSVFDILFVRILWNRIIAVRPPNDEINISKLPKVYDVQQIRSFYKSKPRLVLARATEILSVCRVLVWDLFTDYRLKKTKENEPLRAEQFTQLITRLGPSFIKFGQALSIRPDICSPVYLEQLIKLQDQVPPFSSEEALQIINKELNKNGFSPSDVFSRLSDFNECVAAASLGQGNQSSLHCQCSL